MKQDVLRMLKGLNFTEYEAKAYMALLEKSPMSGYAIALSSGVPRSKIYEVLNGLVERGEIFVSHEDPALYIPLSPQELISNKKRKADAAFDEASKCLEVFHATMQNRDHIWNITGYNAIIGRIKESIKRASSRILLEIWKEDAELLKDELQTLSATGIEIIIVSYGELDFDFADVYPHDASDEITLEYGGRWIVLSIDDIEVIAGIVSLGEDSRAAWTMHPGLVMPITEVIVHDLYIMEMLRAHRPILESSFGPNLIELRKRFNIGPSGFTVATKLGFVK
ncbi:TrmB family transcriptional regulator [Alicyclobacillus fodiniaquatilis]|uniref:TrmB family transcriptional regulator n=1 Tax=Alicyclobacillus fodiniaquatilis TaxID=1661150 RepID=A0ABW4JII2_9BACL